MKKTLLMISFLIIFSCFKDNSTGNLPEETQIGANTVGCLVNGKILVPYQVGLNPSVVCSYEEDNGEFYFLLRFSDMRGIIGRNLTVKTEKITLQEGETYALNVTLGNNNYDWTGGSGLYRVSSIFYTNSIYSGELTITRNDLSRSIISGTFWFNAINDEGGIVEIREGRFDWNY